MYLFICTLTLEAKLPEGKNFACLVCCSIASNQIKFLILSKSFRYFEAKIAHSQMIIPIFVLPNLKVIENI